MPTRSYSSRRRRSRKVSTRRLSRRRHRASRSQLAPLMLATQLSLVKQMQPQTLQAPHTFPPAPAVRHAFQEAAQTARAAVNVFQGVSRQATLSGTPQVRTSPALSMTLLKQSQHQLKDAKTPVEEASAVKDAFQAMNASSSAGEAAAVSAALAGEGRKVIIEQLRNQGATKEEIKEVTKKLEEVQKGAEKQVHDKEFKKATKEVVKKAVEKGGFAKKLFVTALLGAGLYVGSQFSGNLFQHGQTNQNMTTTNNLLNSTDSFAKTANNLLYPQNVTAPPTWSNSVKSLFTQLYTTSSDAVQTLFSRPPTTSLAKTPSLTDVELTAADVALQELHFSGDIFGNALLYDMIFTKQEFEAGTVDTQRLLSIVAVRPHQVNAAGEKIRETALQMQGTYTKIQFSELVKTDITQFRNFLFNLISRSPLTQPVVLEIDMDTPLDSLPKNVDHFSMFLTMLQDRGTVQGFDPTGLQISIPANLQLHVVIPVSQPGSDLTSTDVKNILEKAINKAHINKGARITSTAFVSRVTHTYTSL